MPDPIKLPPGAQLVDSGGGMKLPPGASLVGDAATSTDPTPGSAQDVAAKLAGTKLPPLAPSVMDTLGEGITPPTTLGGAITSAVKEGIYHPQGFQAVRNILNLGNQAAKGQNENVKAMGERGDLSPTATGLLSLPSGVAESATRIGAGMSTPGNATLAAASLHPALRLPVAAYGAVTGGKAMLDSADNLSDPDKLEQFLLGGSGVAGSAALGASAKLPTPSNLRYPNGPPLAPTDVVERLKTAVVPAAKDANAFSRNLTEKLDPIMSNSNVSDLPALEQHLKSVGDAQPYVSKVLGPNATKPSYPRSIPNYSGPVNALGDSTIGEMSAHLKQLNAQMQPKYVVGPDGSMQQQAAVNAPQMAQLQAEAQAIRSHLAGELAKHTGLPPEQVEAMRSDWSKIDDLRDTVNQRVNEMRQKADLARQNPPNLHETAFGAGKSLVEKGIRAIQDRGNNPRSPDAIVRDTFQRYQGKPTPPLAISPPSGRPPRPAPPWQQPGPGASSPPSAPLAPQAGQPSAATPPSSVPPEVQAAIGASTPPEPPSLVRAPAERAAYSGPERRAATRTGPSSRIGEFRKELAGTTDPTVRAELEATIQREIAFQNRAPLTPDVPHQNLPPEGAAEHHLATGPPIPAYRTQLEAGAVPVRNKGAARATPLAPSEPRIATVDVKGAHSPAGTAGTVPLSQLLDALRAGHVPADPAALADTIESMLKNGGK